MKRLLVLSTAFVALAACSGTASVRYQLAMPAVTDSAKILTLTQQSMRVMQQRLESMGEMPDIAVEQGSSTGSVIVGISTASQEALDALTGDLQEAFDFQIMSETQGGEQADTQVEGHGGFTKTGITGADLAWVEGGKEPDSDLGMVQLVFTQEGRTKMVDLFKRMEGKNIGIFVRGQLVSKLQVESAELKDDIIIRQIPNVDLAQTFGDDVNVGIHVTFTQLP